MRDYFKNTEYVLQNVEFDYSGGNYQGRGIMTWKPQDGFHIEAFLDRRGEPLPRETHYGKVGIVPRGDLCSIRLKSPQFDWGITPKLVLSNHLELISENRLSANFGKILLFGRSGLRDDYQNHLGSSLFHASNWPVFPDSLQREVHIGGRKIEEGYEAAGIRYEIDQNQEVTGRLIDKNSLEMHWCLSRSAWSRAENWRWATAIQNALAILSGHTIQLLQREISYGSRKCTEIRKLGETNSLGLLHPLENPQVVDKTTLMSLIEFFVRDTGNGKICRNIFTQMSEAARQNSWQAKELLLSTVLEAALRSIDKAPFQPGHNSWVIDRSMKQFRETYFSREWKKLFKNALEIHRKLRHRNAHPDWLFSQGGALSPEDMTESLDNMIFLSRFYGYMILALAGFKNLQPVFPAPHKDWKPIMTISRA